MSEATEPTAENGAGMPPLPASSRPWLTTAILGTLFTVAVVAGVLRVTDAIGEVAFWRVLTFTALTNLVIALVQNRQLLRDAEAWDAVCRSMLATFNAIRVKPVVRCAGCHTRSVLLRHPDADPEDDLPLPPGWGLYNDRPYCERCLEEVEA